MIKYKLWNRQLPNQSRCYDPEDKVVEIILYDQHYQNKGRIIATTCYANLLSGSYVSPLEVYSKTNGTMGR